MGLGKAPRRQANHIIRKTRLVTVVILTVILRSAVNGSSHQRNCSLSTVRMTEIGNHE